MKFCRISIVKYLNEKGANIEARDDNIHLASIYDITYIFLFTKQKYKNLEKIAKNNFQRQTTSCESANGVLFPTLQKNLFF